MDRGCTTRLQITPPQIVGPFYPVAERPDLAADLARPSGSAAEARGQLLHVMGRVLSRSGEPVAHARIEIWQANAAGKYRHPSDTNPAPLDPNFKGFAQLQTDAAGRYAFRTGALSNDSSPHVSSRDEPSVARVLKQAGYVTGMAGKWRQMGGLRAQDR